MRAERFNPGDVINGLVYVSEFSATPRKITVKCYCGKEFNVMLRSVISGNTKSCGCWGAKSRSIRFTKHGLRKHDLYRVWCGIKTRCYNKNRADYKYYGGQGVLLSDEFLDFKTWFDYVISLPNYDHRKQNKLTIDRIDVFKNYERNNLRWATRLEQSLNQRRNSGV